MNPIQTQKSVVPLGRVRAGNKEVPVYIAEEWRRMFDDMVRRINDMQDRLTALEANNG